MNQANLLCHKMKIPETLDQLMFCLTKEILCKQPENVYEFAADFFHQLVEARNGTDRNSFPRPHVATSLSMKGNSVTTHSTRRTDNDQFNEENKETDDFEKELLQLNEDKTEIDGDVSPPPTLDESMSDHESSPVTIAAIVTSKTLESPRSVIFTSLSRPTSVSLENQKSSEDLGEETDSFDVNYQVSSSSNFLDSEADLQPVPIDEVTDEMNLAAIQIQSAYRGHRARREIMVTNQNTMIETMNTSTDLVDHNDEEFEKELIEGGVEKVELEEINEEDKTKGIDDNVKEDGEVACAYNTNINDSESVEKISVDNVICNSSVMEEFSEGKTEDEIDYAEKDFETQTKQFVESLTEPDFTDRVDSIENIIEQKDDDNIPQTNTIDSDNTMDFVSEKMQVLSTVAIESAQLDQENYKAGIGDKEDESQEGNGLEEELEKIDGPEINEYLEKSEIETKNDLLTTEKIFDAQSAEDSKTEYFSTEISEDIIELEKDYSSVELKIHCDDEQENALLTENAEPSIDSLDTQEEQIYPQGTENSTSDETAVVTEDILELDRHMGVTENKDWSDSDHGPSEDQILSPILNEDGGFLNQPLSSDVQMANDENSSATEKMHNYHSSLNTFRNDEEDYIGNTEAETNSEISKGIPEWIDQDDATPQQAENSTESSPVILEETENFSNLSDHLVEFTQHTTNSEDETTILGNNTNTSSDNEDHLMNTNEQNVGSIHRYDTTESKDIENNVVVDQAYNVLFEEGDQDASNDDEEEIWSKLQKDIELEEQQQHLAAIKIQSTFRGYKTRKDFNLASDNQEIMKLDDTPEPTNTDSEGNASIEGNQLALEYTLDESLKDNDHDDGLSEALAGVTETIASVALFMTDTPQPNSTLSFGENTHEGVTNEIPNNDNDEDRALLANVNEVNDVTEELMSNGEEINNIQLIDSYVIVSSIADKPNSPITLDTSNVDGNQEIGTNSDGEKNGSTIILDNTVNEIVTPDPEGVFELYVESNETTNDGLLESYWQPKEESTQCLNYNDLEKNEVLTIKRSFEEEEENAAATKIQAGYRGYQDRKRLKDKKYIPDVTNSDIMQFTEQVNTVFGDDKCIKRNDGTKSLIEVENDAATKIQAGYRGHQDRKQVKLLKEQITNPKLINNEETQFTEKVNVAFDDERIKRNHDTTRLLEVENDAATKIQAGYRGHQDRIRVKHLKDQIKTNPDVLDSGNDFDKTKKMCGSHEIVQHNNPPNPTSIELENAAATKIQASYRGHQDRKRTKHLKGQITNPHRVDIDEPQLFEKATVKTDSEECMKKNQVNVTAIEQQNSAATKIQSSFRGHQDRKRVKNLKDQLLPSYVAMGNDQTLKIDETNTTDSQRPIPCNQLNLTSIELEKAAATKIQAGYRGHQDRKRVKHLKDQIKNPDTVDIDKTRLVEKNILNSSDEFVLQTQRNVTSAEEENAAATKIQAGYRGHQDRKKIKHLKDQRVENNVLHNDGNQYQEETIQLNADNRVLKMSPPEVHSLELENAAATKIQAGYRGHQDRKRIQLLKDQTTENKILDNAENEHDEATFKFNSDDYVLKLSQPELSLELENAAATKIQAGYRGHQDRKRVQLLKDQTAENKILDNDENQPDEELENAAATKIQAGYRGHQDRKRVQLLKDQTSENKILDNEENQRDEGTFKLSSDDYTLELPQPEISLELENAAATKIQAGYRGHQDRKKVKHLKDQTVENKLLEYDENKSDKGSCISDNQFPKPVQAEIISLELENAAATKIQAGYRGHKDRKRIQHLKDQEAEYRINHEENQHNERATQFNSEEYALVKFAQTEVTSFELENAAATKIQASYRGHQDRKRVRNFKAELANPYVADIDETELDNTKFEEKTMEHESDDLIRNTRPHEAYTELENAAATKIQSGFRGHQDRKRVQHLRQNTSASQ